MLSNKEDGAETIYTYDKLNRLTEVIYPLDKLMSLQQEQHPPNNKVNGNETNEKEEKSENPNKPDKLNPNDKDRKTSLNNDLPESQLMYIEKVYANSKGNDKDNKSNNGGKPDKSTPDNNYLEEERQIFNEQPKYLIQPQSKVTYTYDAVGNRLSSTDDTGTTNYKYNAANQLIKAGSTTFDYDNNGNLISENNGEREIQYLYNNANQLIRVQMPDDTYVEYSYDALGRKIYREEANIHLSELEKQNNNGNGQDKEKSNNASSKSQGQDKSNNSNNSNNDKNDKGINNAINNGEGKKVGLYNKLDESQYKLDIEKTTYQYQGLSTVLHKEYSDKGSPYAEYFIGPNNSVVSRKMFGLHGLTNTAKEPDLNTNGGLMYYQYTGLNTVSEITDRHGDIIEKYRYDAYGNIVKGITAPYNTTGYTSHTYDDKSGLIDMNARWYNPSIGRFMQEDTYQGRITEPLTQNRYSYVLNNPINLWDPTGYAAEEGTGGGVGGGTTDWVPASYHIEEWENLDYRIDSEWFIDYSKYEIYVDDWVLTEREFTRDTVYSTWTREVEEIFGYLKKVRTFEKKSDEYTGHRWEILKDTSYYEETHSITSVYEWYDDVPRRLFNLYDYEHPPENLDSLTPKYTVNKKLGTSIILAGDERAANETRSSNWSKALNNVLGIHSTVTGIKSNLLLGGYDALKGTVVGLYDLGIGLIDYTGRLINDPRTTITDTRYTINYLKDNRFIIGYEIGRGIANTFEEEVIYGDANSIARYTGRTATEILLAVIGTRGIDKAAKTTSAGRTINKVDNVIPSGGMGKGVDDFGTIGVRIDTIDDITNYGKNLGKDGQLFVTNKDAISGLDLTNPADLAKAEEILGLPSGRLVNSNINVLTEIDDY